MPDLRPELETLITILMISLAITALLGLFFVLPVGLIHWSWNMISEYVYLLAPINACQALLLYVAGLMVIYLSGLVRIEFRVERQD